MKNFPRIIFYGTPGFAAASLERLVDAGYPVIAVVTAPDRPAGRGLKARESAVKITAVKHGIPVLQPVNMKDPAFAALLEGLKPDLQVVIAFRMMPRQVWSLPPLGTFNLHASLLPQYRGAAPINWAVINGETETGVTTFFLNDEIDTGKIILSEKVSIGPSDSAGDLHDRLMETGSGLVIRTVESIISGNVRETPQENLAGAIGTLKPAPKIFKEDCRIDWDRDVSTVYNFIRGMSPSPGAWSLLQMPDGSRQSYKVLASTMEAGHTGLAPGVIVTDGKTTLKVAARGGFICPVTIQLAGRKVMHTVDFLRGFGRIFAETRDL
jgi:methionyl-tRNA formyltransferase